MTRDEAGELVGLMREAAVFQEVDGPRLDAMEIALTPLPFAECERRIGQWALAVQTDKDGRRVPKFLSTADDVLAAVGVGPAARGLIHRAISEGGEVWPSLRQDGWEYVAPGAPLPRGVGEWHANLGLPPPAGRTVAAALPAPTPLRPDQEPHRAAASLLPTIIGDLRQRKTVALRRAFEERQRPSPPALPDRDAWPPALREAVEAAEAAHDRAQQAAARCAQQEAAYREMCGQLARQIRECAPDSEAAKPIAVELLQRLLADPGYGPAAVAEVLRDALNPALRIAFCRLERGANVDPFTDEPGDVVRFRLAIE